MDDNSWTDSSANKSNKLLVTLCIAILGRHTARILETDLIDISHRRTQEFSGEGGGGGAEREYIYIEIMSV
jgi:hypothetical protein